MTKIINKCPHPEDIACQDGMCPDCNFYEYQLWLVKHLHCDTGSWECPDPDDCPHKKDSVWVLWSD